MEEDKAQRVKREYGTLKQQRVPIDLLRQEIANFIFPLREDFQQAPNEPHNKRKATNIYDGTAVSALNLAADGFHGNMISPAMRWFIMKLPAKLKTLFKIPEIRLWLQDYTESIYSEFQNSNFYSEMRMFLRDGLSISPGAMYVEEDIKKGRICFRTLHPKDGVMAEDMYGNVDKFIRNEWLSARQAVQKFGVDVLSEQIKYAYENNPFQVYEFLHSVSPRSEFNTKKIDARNKPIESVWMEKSGNTIARESGFDLFPYIVWRYCSNSSDVYGDSPATFALPEIKRLNVISKGVSGAAQLSTEPAYQIPVEMKGKARLGPHGINYYSDPSRRIFRVQSEGAFPVALDREERIRSLIREHYNVDFFLMLAQSDRQKTIYETLEITGEKALVLGAATSSLIMTLDNIIDYVVYLGTNAGRIPEPPDVLKAFAGGARIDTVYTGTLAQAQRRLFETQSITKSLELAFPLMQLYPEGVDVVNPTESIKKILISNGYPEDCLNTEEGIAQIRKARAEGQGSEIQKQDQDRMSDVIKKLSQAAKNAGINLQDLMASMGGETPSG